MHLHEHALIGEHDEFEYVWLKDEIPWWYLVCLILIYLCSYLDEDKYVATLSMLLLG